MKNIVVVPTYSEAATVTDVLDAVCELQGIDVLVVDDSSPDGTADIVESYGGSADRVHLLRRTGRRGLGPSYVDGFKYALANGYEAVMTMDADLSHNPANLPDLLAALDTHDVAVGSRYCDGRVSVVNWPLSRLFLSVFAGKYVRLITRLRISDPTSGFRAFRTSVLEAMNLDTIRSNGYSFQIETLYRAWRCGFSMREVPIIFTERKEGHSKMSKRIILEAALMPWRLRFSGFRPHDR